MSDVIPDSVEKGMQFLKDTKPNQIHFEIRTGGWSGSVPIGESARQLDRTIDAGQHSGFTYQAALKSIFNKAQQELGYKLGVSDAPARGESARQYISLTL